MNRKLVVAISLLALLLSALVANAQGQTRTPGVHQGDYFTYVVIAYWNSNDPHAAVPADLLVLNQTLAYNVTIADVSGSNVTSEETWHFMNGTDRPTVVVQSLDSGDSFFMKGLVDVNMIGANLGVNNLLHPSGGDHWRINQTITVDFGGNERDANAVLFGGQILDSSTTDISQIANGYGYTNYYFDKATGILVARYDNTVGSGENTSELILLAKTNLWQISTLPKIDTTDSSPQETSIPTQSQSPSDTIQIFGLSVSTPVLAAVLVIVIVVLVASVLFYAKRKSRKRKFRR